MSNKPDLQRTVGRAVDDLIRLTDRVLPVKIGRTAVNHTKDHFLRGGYGGQTWKEPYRRRLSFNGAQAHYGTLLSGTNHLRDSTDRDYPKRGQVRIFNEVAYAGVHNDGATITVTARMKKYFWARHYEALGARVRTKKGKLSRSKYNEAMNREAAFWRAMATKKVGTMIKMPKRKFFGIDNALKAKVNKIINDELYQLAHGIYSGKYR